jgi:LDH2 family malate/lactate/ureidoglycolate dehydrogenase
MLERFKVPPEDQVRVTHESLRVTSAAIFEKMGETHQDAAIAADVLVATDLRGVESHGVSNMLRYYVQYYQDGSMKARPDWRIVREAPGTATIDADAGLAIILGPKAMQIAIDKAKKVGVGVVNMFNAGHSGAIGHHAMLAAEQDMIGMCMTAGGLRVVPTFGAEPMFGTNPIAIAAPAGKEAPFLFDAATCSIAVNKIRLAERLGEKLLPGWVTDADGTPIMEETAVVTDDVHALLPLGATREQGSHKGYGFAMMAEVLATLLSGALPTMLEGDGVKGKHYFAAYNIEAFTDVDTFKDNMDAMLQRLKNTRPAPGHDRVLYPGLSEYEDEQDRRANGIPLHKEVVQWIQDTASEFAVPTLTTV